MYQNKLTFHKKVKIKMGKCKCKILLPLRKSIPHPLKVGMG